jgi:hypothetical protein
MGQLSLLTAPPCSLGTEGLNRPQLRPRSPQLLNQKEVAPNEGPWVGGILFFISFSPPSLFLPFI